MKRIIIILSSIICIGLLVIGGLAFYQNSQNGYSDTKNFHDQVTNLVDHPKRETVLVFHKPGCARCKKARATINETIKNNPKRHYIVINVNQDGASDLVAKYGVTHYPTIILLKGNQVINSTSSIDAGVIQKTMLGE